MNKLMYKMANFFQGRYGIDELYKFLFILFLDYRYFKYIYKKSNYIPFRNTNLCFYVL